MVQRGPEKLFSVHQLCIIAGISGFFVPGGRK
jgi:hypothetical protein